MVDIHQKVAWPQIAHEESIHNLSLLITIGHTFMKSPVPKPLRNGLSNVLSLFLASAVTILCHPLPPKVSYKKRMETHKSKRIYVIDG